MIFEQLEVGWYRTFAYLIADEAAGKAALVDPSAELERVAFEVSRRFLKLEYVFNTHSHTDHTGGNTYFKKFGAKVVAHESAPTHPDLTVRHGDILKVGAISVSVLHTPGHRFDSICLIAGGNLYTGDTLYLGSCGRTDLPGGDSAAMHHTLMTIIRPLPDGLEVMPGHNYATVSHRALGEEKRLNPALAPRSLQEFRAFVAAP
jgi:hydroxyacylglutathione hydrolase